MVGENLGPSQQAKATPKLHERAHSDPWLAKLFPCEWMLLVMQRSGVQYL